jgi:hypothetical protein
VWQEPPRRTFHTLTCAREYTHSQTDAAVVEELLPKHAPRLSALIASSDYTSALDPILSDFLMCMTTTTFPTVHRHRPLFSVAHLCVFFSCLSFHLLLSFLICSYCFLLPPPPPHRLCPNSHVSVLHCSYILHCFMTLHFEFSTSHCSNRFCSYSLFSVLHLRSTVLLGHGASSSRRHVVLRFSYASGRDCRVLQTPRWETHAVRRRPRRD